MNFDGIGFLYMLRVLLIHLNAYKYKINYFHKFNNLTKRERTVLITLKWLAAHNGHRLSNYFSRCLQRKAFNNSHEHSYSYFVVFQ